MGTIELITKPLKVGSWSIYFDSL